MRRSGLGLLDAWVWVEVVTLGCVLGFRAVDSGLFAGGLGGLRGWEWMGVSSANLKSPSVHGRGRIEDRSGEADYHD